MDKNQQVKQKEGDKDEKSENINQQENNLNIVDTNTVKTQAEKEAEVLKFWNDNKIFEKSVNLNKVKNELENESEGASEGGGDKFVFYDGPPFATGLPHHGHILQSFMKDSVPRYMTMKGKSVRRVWGWDCHGLPIENMIEKELGLKSKKDIELYGIEKFYRACADSVLRYEKDWKEIVPRTGRWIDMENCYKTMDATYTESVWWSFSQMYKKGLAYEGYKVMHICPRCETPLAQSEVALGGYKDTTDISVYVPFELEGEADTYMLAWTTTPWTLPGNTAIAINKDIEYTKVKVIKSNDEKQIGKQYILSEKFIESLFTKKSIEVEIVEKFLGEKLLGLTYKPVFDYYINAEMRNKENIYKVWHADFVNDEMGTGIAHEAPVFGEDDMTLAIANDIPLIRHVKMNGMFEDEVIDFKDLIVKSKGDTQSTDIEIIKWLAHNGKLFAKEKIIHPYPHCWRCDTPLLNYGTSSWFVAVSKMRDRLVEENKEIKWIPENVRDGRFGKWLEGARDWAVSRNRYWGAPIPVWKSEATGEVFVPGSLSELKTRIEKRNNYTFIRHGEIDGNLTNKVSLNKDTDPLNEDGVQQVRAAAEKIKAGNKKYDIIIISPFLRTRQTADIIAEGIDFDKNNIVVDDRLSEWNIGHELNGMSWKDLNDEFYSSNKDFYYDSMSMSGESKNDMQKRVNHLLSELDEKYKDKNILLVTHRATICSAVSAVEGEIFQKGTNNHKVWRKIANAEILELDYRNFPHDESGAVNFHMPFIDKVKVYDKEGNLMVRDKLVFDCWYESGSMPYAQLHFPFENKELFESNYPANFIGEAQDQTRGWFYTLLILGIGLFDKKPMENVICTGLIMAEDGVKLSKSLKNFTDPMELVDKYGSDAMRYYLLSSPVIKGENVKFGDKGLGDVYRKNIVRLTNVLSMYNMYKDESIKASNSSIHSLDKYIIARLKEVKSQISEGFEILELDRAFRPVEGFIDDLSLWYIRRSRERIKSMDEQVRNEAMGTLRYVLFEFSKAIAPILPFLSEMIYKDTKDISEMVESVHLQGWGENSPLSVEEAELVVNTAKIRKIITAILDERVKANIKVRQPLGSAVISDKYNFNSPNKDELINEVKEETNIKQITFGKIDDTLDVILNATLDEELILEGAIRELARSLQDMRKEMKLNTQDIVTLNLKVEDENKLENIKSKITIYQSDIAAQCNIKEIKYEIGNLGELKKVEFLGISVEVDINL